MKRASQFLALSAGSALVALLLAEIGVRAFVAVRNVGPAFTAYDPVFGKRLKSEFSTTRISPEFAMRLTTNSLGFRGPEPEAPPRDVVLFLGDSFTMGYGVDDGEEYPALLREALSRRKIPVVNAGMGNNGNGRWILFLERVAPAYAPRLVILQIHENDFLDNHLEELFGLSDVGELEPLPVPTPGLERRAQEIIESVPGLAYLHLVGLMRQIRLPGAGRSLPTGRSQPGAQPTLAPLTHRLLERALSICAERGWPVLVVLVGLEEERRGPLEELLSGRDVPFVVVPRKSKRPDLYYEVDGHWRPSGHAYVAERLLASAAFRKAIVGQRAARGVTGE